MEIKKCLQRTDGIKYVIVPKESEINKGDDVALIKIDEEEVKQNAKRREKS